MRYELCHSYSHTSIYKKNIALLLTKMLILKCERITEIFSYDHRVYESVNDRILSWVIYHKSTESRTQEPKG